MVQYRLGSFSDSANPEWSAAASAGICSLMPAVRLRRRPRRPRSSVPTARESSLAKLPMLNRWPLMTPYTSSVPVKSSCSLQRTWLMSRKDGPSWRLPRFVMSLHRWSHQDAALVIVSTARWLTKSCPLGPKHGRASNGGVTPEGQTDTSRTQDMPQRLTSLGVMTTGETNSRKSANDAGSPYRSPSRGLRCRCCPS